MTRAAIHTTDAPAAVGPYSQAIAIDGFVFCSGQAALDPVTGALAEGGIEPETERVLANLTAVLDAAGCGWERCRQEHRLPDRHGRFRGDERDLRPVRLGAAARPIDGRGRRVAQGRMRRDRGHRPTAGLSGLRPCGLGHDRRPPRLTPRTGRPYDAAPI